MNGNMEIDKKPNQEKTIENSEKNILFRFPIFNSPVKVQSCVGS